MQTSSYNNLTATNATLTTSIVSNNLFSKKLSQNLHTSTSEKHQISPNITQHLFSEIRQPHNSEVIPYSPNCSSINTTAQCGVTSTKSSASVSYSDQLTSTSSKKLTINPPSVSSGCLFQPSSLKSRSKGVKFTLPEQHEKENKSFSAIQDSKQGTSSHNQHQQQKGIKQSNQSSLFYRPAVQSEQHQQSLPQTVQQRTSGLSSILLSVESPRNLSQLMSPNSSSSINTSSSPCDSQRSFTQLFAEEFKKKQQLNLEGAQPQQQTSSQQGNQSNNQQQKASMAATQHPPQTFTRTKVNNLVLQEYCLSELPTQSLSRMEDSSINYQANSSSAFSSSSSSYASPAISNNNSSISNNSSSDVVSSSISREILNLNSQYYNRSSCLTSQEGQTSPSFLLPPSSSRVSSSAILIEEYCGNSFEKTSYSNSITSTLNKTKSNPLTPRARLTLVDRQAFNSSLPGSNKSITKPYNNVSNKLPTEPSRRESPSPNNNTSMSLGNSTSAQQLLLKRKSHMHVDMLACEQILTLPSTAPISARISPRSEIVGNEKQITKHLSNQQVVRFMKAHSWWIPNTWIDKEVFTTELFREHPYLTGEEQQQSINMDASLKKQLKEKIVDVVCKKQGPKQFQMDFSKLEEVTKQGGLLGLVHQALILLAEIHPELSVSVKSSIDAQLGCSNRTSNSIRSARALDIASSSNNTSLEQYPSNSKSSQEIDHRINGLQFALQLQQGDLTNIKNILQEFMESMYREMERELYSKLSVEMRRLTVKFSQTEELYKRVSRCVDENFDVVQLKQSFSLKLAAIQNKCTFFEAEVCNKVKELDSLAQTAAQLFNDKIRLTAECERLHDRCEEYLLYGLRCIQPLHDNRLEYEHAQHLSQQRAFFDGQISELRMQKVKRGGEGRQNEKQTATTTGDGFSSSGLLRSMDTLISSSSSEVHKKNLEESVSVIEMLRDVSQIMCVSTESKVAENILRFAYFSQLSTYLAGTVSSARTATIEVRNVLNSFTQETNALNNNVKLLTDLVSVVLSKEASEVEYSVYSVLAQALQKGEENSWRRLVEEFRIAELILRVLKNGKLSPNAVQRCLEFLNDCFAGGDCSIMRSENIDSLLEVLKSAFLFEETKKGLFLLHEIMKRSAKGSIITEESQRKVTSLLEQIANRGYGGGLSNKGEEERKVIEDIISQIRKTQALFRDEDMGYNSIATTTVTLNIANDDADQKQKRNCY